MRKLLAFKPDEILVVVAQHEEELNSYTSTHYITLNQLWTIVRQHMDMLYHIKWWQGGYHKIDFKELRKESRSWGSGHDETTILNLFDYKPMSFSSTSLNEHGKRVMLQLCADLAEAAGINTIDVQDYIVKTDTLERAAKPVIDLGVPLAPLLNKERVSRLTLVGDAFYQGSLNKEDRTAINKVTIKGVFHNIEWSRGSDSAINLPSKFEANEVWLHRLSYSTVSTRKFASVHDYMNRPERLAEIEERERLKSKTVSVKSSTKTIERKELTFTDGYGTPLKTNDYVLVSVKDDAPRMARIVGQTAHNVRVMWATRKPQQTECVSANTLLKVF